MAPTQYRILVVDDEDAVAGLLRHLLAAEGYETARARDGREALAFMSECPADLVLLDLDMPGLGGFEVCRRLKSDPATRLTPVIILTGHSALDARLRAWELGARSAPTATARSTRSK